MTTQNTAEKKIEELKKIFKEFEVVAMALRNAGIILDNPLFDAIYNIETFAIKTLAENIGIELAAMEWFIIDNNWGENKFECQKDKGKPVIINSIKAFLEFEKKGK